MKTKKHLFEYLIQPSHLFLKQVIKIVETKTHIMVMDLRKTKQLSIPEHILRSLDYRLRAVKNMASRHQEYDGVSFVLVPK